MKKDLTGQRFGRLSVKEYVGNNKRQDALWRCVCDCGGETITKTGTLTSGDSTSCGCRRREVVQETFRKPAGVSGFRGLFSGYQRMAASRGLEFELSEGYFRQLTSSICRYCGKEPAQSSFRVSGMSAPEAKQHSTYIYNGIDRVNSNQGYTVANCVPACGRCNVGKMALDVEEFFDWIKAVYEHTFLRTRP